MNPNREPLIYVGAALIVLVTLKSILSGEEIGPTMIQDFLIAVGILTGRSFVTPNRTVVEETVKAAKAATSFERKYHDE